MKKADVSKEDITMQLIQALRLGNLTETRVAIELGADVNCRVKFKDGVVTIATSDDLAMQLTSECEPQTADMPAYEGVVQYTVPMARTTTLLNLLARKIFPEEQLENNCALADILMHHGAELGGIDHQSFWSSWGDAPQNYFQNTPLLNAIASENLDFAICYMKHIAHLDEASRCEILNYKDKFIAGFHTALEFAIRRGYSGLASSIVCAGADTNPQPFVYAYGGKSPLHMACMLFGNSMTKKGTWSPILGNDLQLIVDLLEHGADYTLPVMTVVSGESQPIGLTPFDYIPEMLVSTHASRFNIIHACSCRAFSPQRGQVRHPFNEEECFIAKQAQSNYLKDINNKTARSRYLESQQFLKTDIQILQKTWLKRVMRDYNKIFYDDTLDGLLALIDDSSLDFYFFVEQIEDAMRSVGRSEWFDNRLGCIGEHHDELAAEENPLFNPTLRNRISHRSIATDVISEDESDSHLKTPRG
jgi:hypothetical protein